MEKNNLDMQDIQTLADNLRPSSAPDSVFDAIKSKLKKRIHDSAPEGTITIRNVERRWVALDKKIDISVLYRDPADKYQIALWRLKPGAKIMDHNHSMDEECIVMEGEVAFGDIHCKAGDFHMMLKGTSHNGIYSEQGCLLYVKNEFIPELHAA